MTVQDVLEYLAGGMSEDEILEDFSDLIREDLKACIAYNSAVLQNAYMIFTIL